MITKSDHTNHALKFLPAGIALMVAALSVFAALACEPRPKPGPAPEPTPTVTPLPTVPGEDGKSCVDASGQVFAHGYRYSIGSTVFECRDGHFAEVK